MEDADKENFIQQMKQKGFSLEILTGSQFSNRGWTVIHQRIFYDETENKSRYVDLAAHKLIENENGFFQKLNYTVIVECKKSDKPWIFYSPNTSYLIEERDLAALNYIKMISRPSIAPKDFVPLFVDSHYFLKGPVDRTAQAGYVLFRNNATEYDQIFAATNQVVKALRFQRESVLHSMKSGLVNSLFVVYHPLIVFDGKLCEYSLDSNNEPKLTETTYLKYQVDFLDLPQNPPEGFLIDVVTIDALP